MRSSNTPVSNNCSKYLSKQQEQLGMYSILFVKLYGTLVHSVLDKHILIWFDLLLFNLINHWFDEASQETFTTHSNLKMLVTAESVKMSSNTIFDWNSYTPWNPMSRLSLLRKLFLKGSSTAAILLSLLYIMHKIRIVLNVFVCKWNAFSQEWPCFWVSVLLSSGKGC